MKFLSTRDILGRSILEMLGVLAIIGVLSLAAIWGYPILMIKHRANTIISNVIEPQIILTLSQKNLDKRPAGALLFDVDVSPYEHYASFALEKTKTGNLKLSITQVDKKLCQKIVEQLLPVEPNILLSINETNRGRVELCALDKNTIDIYFPHDLALPSPDRPCGDNPCRENFVCDAATNQCVCNQLLDKNGSCLPCNTSSNVETSKNDCAKCKNRTYQEGLCLLSCDNEQIRGDDLKCYNCSGTAPITNVDMGRCLLCAGKRFWNNSAQTCWSCDDKTPRYSDEELGCTDCPNRFLTSNNLCVWCESEQSYGTTAEQCAACGDKRFYIASLGMCIISCNSNQFAGADGKCHSCEEAGLIASDGTECYKCSNRYLVGGKCGRCEDMGSTSSADKTNCLRCPQTNYINYQCSRCENITAIASISQEECNRCPDMSYYEDKCYPCLRSESWDSWSDKQCDMCPNRVLDKNSKYAYCHLPCSSGQIWAHNFRACMSCTRIDGLNANNKEACLSACPGQRFWNVGTATCWSCSDPTERRSDEENGCHTCPNRFLRSGSKGAKADYCAPCDLNTDVYAPQANCNRCPTRFYRASDGLCLKPCAAGKVRQPDGTCA